MPRAKKISQPTNNNEYISKGVSITPAIPEAGTDLTILYDGILAKSGANHIYAHVGFGNNWDNKDFLKMEKSVTGFQVTFPVNITNTLNICFKDCADNWDNNSGKNYSFDVN